MDDGRWTMDDGVRIAPGLLHRPSSIVHRLLGDEQFAHGSNGGWRGTCGLGLLGRGLWGLLMRRGGRRRRLGLLGLWLVVWRGRRGWRRSMGCGRIRAWGLYWQTWMWWIFA